MADKFPLEKIEPIHEDMPLFVGKNSVVYKCPYSQEYIPKNRAAVSIGVEEKEVCFDPKYIEEMAGKLSKNDLSEDIEYIEQCSSDCISCRQSGSGYIIEVYYYISCGLDSRSESMSMDDLLTSHKETKTLFLCMECMTTLSKQFPNDTVNSVVASQTV